MVMLGVVFKSLRSKTFGINGAIVNRDEVEFLIEHLPAKWRQEVSGDSLTHAATLSQESAIKNKI